MNLAELTARYRHRETARIVEIDTGGGRRELTHAELGVAVEDRARWLRDAGVGAGRRIGIRASNSIDWVTWDLAALAVGAVVQAFPDETEIDDRAAFAARHGLAVLVDGDAVHRAEPAPPAEEVPGDLHSLVYSSGTSGALKGLRISRAGTEYVINRFVDSFAVTPADRHLIFLPLANYQQRLSVYCCLWVGADLVLSPYQRVFAAIRQERPTFVIAPPVFYDTVLQLHARTAAGTPLGEFLGGRIRFMITGMAPISRATLDGFRAAGVRLLEAYGMTESGMIAWNTEDAQRVGTVGRLIDPDAVTFLPDGELLIHRPAPLSLGYFDVEPAVAAQTFRPDGAIVTGDYGRLDPDGFLTLVGRKKDVITLGNGRKVHPAEIEGLFAGVPGIADLIVVSTPAQRLGAIVTPVVDGDGERAAIRDGVARVNERLDGHQRISGVAFSAEPLRSDRRFLTANMKLSRTAAADWFAGQADAGPLTAGARSA
ncbi:AMP-binding protein [Micromonospora rubida]|uniref:AMP-binding protein n=1 Tax=Micromonospora rubida TaxID=2697657 RepID=UPI001378F50C|nr:AMP-binding protein [Micromonospora rubida]NBE79817.1 AMP-binding protein [Micromonospora rubida]